MIDIEQQQSKIVEYVKINYPLALDAFVSDLVLPKIDDFVLGYPDFETYQNPTLVFFDFANYQFTKLTSDSELESVTLNLHISLRQDTPENLTKMIFRFANVFYGLFDKNKTMGIMDDGKIEQIHFYQNVEGYNESIKDVEIQIKFTKEIN